MTEKKEERRRIVRDEADRNFAVLNYALHSMVLINDIASGEVTDLYSELRKYPNIFRHGVKNRYRILAEQRRKYTAAFNQLVRGEVELFCDLSDAFNDIVIRDYGMLRMQYVQGMLKRNVPYPHLVAELMFAKDCVNFASANFKSWTEQIYSEAPKLRGRLSMNMLNIEGWLKCVELLIAEVAKVTGADIEVADGEIEGVELAREIIIKKIADPRYISEAGDMVG